MSVNARASARHDAKERGEELPSVGQEPSTIKVLQELRQLHTIKSAQNANVAHYRDTHLSYVWNSKGQRGAHFISSHTHFLSLQISGLHPERLGQLVAGFAELPAPEAPA